MFWSRKHIKCHKRHFKYDDILLKYPPCISFSKRNTSRMFHFFKMNDCVSIFLSLATSTSVAPHRNETVNLFKKHRKIYSTDGHQLKMVQLEIFQFYDGAKGYTFSRTCFIFIPSWACNLGTTLSCPGGSSPSAPSHQGKPRTAACCAAGARGLGVVRAFSI